jgi:hypothetical protein
MFLEPLPKPPLYRLFSNLDPLILVAHSKLLNCENGLLLFCSFDMNQTLLGDLDVCLTLSEGNCTVLTVFGLIRKVAIDVKAWFVDEGASRGNADTQYAVASARSDEEERLRAICDQKYLLEDAICERVHFNLRRLTSKFALYGRSNQESK